ncbi:MAG: hypothetical protein FGM33_01840 [Candidatus Kapabacteria bacterium]|nr:hypothetical protein [Candidatus Kapabacteria bacterium]
MASITVHPEIAPLQERVRELRTQLREALDDWHQLSTVVRPRIHATYASHFGTLERELQEVALAAAEMFRRVELLSIKHERGEKLTAEIVDLINQVVDKEYARFTMRVQEAFRMNERQREDAARKRESEGSDTELVSMYRTLVKQLHPDVADAASDASADDGIWHQVQQAYATRNAAQLRSLVMLLGADAALDRESDEWGIDRWQDEVASLEKRLALEQRKLRRLSSEEPFTMAAELEDEIWRQRHRDDLVRQIAQKHNELRESRRRYDDLTGGLVPPGHNPMKSKQDVSFEEDFMTNTYFGQR